MKGDPLMFLYLIPSFLCGVEPDKEQHFKNALVSVKNLGTEYFSIIQEKEITDLLRAKEEDIIKNLEEILTSQKYSAREYEALIQTFAKGNYSQKLSNQLKKDRTCDKCVIF